MAQVGRPVQQQLHPENPVEEHILRKSPLYGQNDRITLATLQMRAAWNDLTTMNTVESQWPTKEVKVESTVQYPAPGGELKTDTTTRIHRVNMTPEEALAHFAKQYNLTAKDLKKVLPKEIVAATSKKSKKDNVGKKAATSKAKAATPGSKSKKGK